MLHSALAAARRARLVGADAAHLSEVPLDALPDLERAAPEAAFRRARHVLGENERVRVVCRAFETGDVAAAGAALREGMRSLRDDFEVLSKEGPVSGANLADWPIDYDELARVLDHHAVDRRAHSVAGEDSLYPPERRGLGGGSR